jgi:hypothetical protein
MEGLDMKRTTLALTALCLLAAAPAFAAEEAAVDHSKMDHSSVMRDEKGRALYGMKHEMDPKIVQVLRERDPDYRKMSDAELEFAMSQMPPEYAWYISPPGVKGPRGVLILMHGFREPGDSIFKDSVQPIAKSFPTSMGVGMAMMMSQHIQVALDDLKAAGAKEVIVLPATSFETNELYRQWAYILGRSKEYGYSPVPKVKTDLAITIVPPPGGDPWVAETLIDYAKELSTNPKNEVVVIASHGPSTSDDNAKAMQTLATLAKIVKEDGGFSAAYGQTLQDDAPAAIRDANVKKLRAIVEGANKDGKQVIVVTNLIGTRTIQSKLRKDLEGLNYKFNAKGIVEHDNFMRWIETGIQDHIERSAAL